MDAQEAFGLSAPCQVIANACASGTNAIGHAFECVRSGRYQRVLTGGYDALSELVFVGFDSLQASTAERCRPFDRERTGLVLGEGAAILLLENFDSAQARGAKIVAEIIGYGISTDNHHLTQPNPSGSGARQAMEGALQSAGISAGEIDYINAHGTATPFNDAAEGKAIAELFDGVAVSSTKGMMGHSLGAAGAIEAVISLLALRNQFLPPNINFRNGDAGLDLNIVANSSQPGRLRTVLSNSFGFGGTNASVIIRAIEGMSLGIAGMGWVTPLGSDRDRRLAASAERRDRLRRNQFPARSVAPTLCSPCRPRPSPKRPRIRGCAGPARFHDSLSSRDWPRWKTRN